MARRVRSRLRSALKAQKVRKDCRTFSLLGCSVQEYRNYLEGLFSQGMSWDNMHLWHIDHIMPVAAFNLQDPEEARMAFHYKNTQPMWADENMSKSATFSFQDLIDYKQSWKAT